MAMYGPFTTSTQTTSRWYFQQKYKSTDRRVPLPYRVGVDHSTGFWNLVTTSNNGSIALAEAADLSTKCYDRFWGSLHKRAELALTLFEGKQALMMVSKRALQIARAAQALRRGRLGDFVRELGVRRHPRTAAAMAKVRRNATSASNTWLEFTFGWVPLVEDIGNAVGVLQQDFGFFRHKATVKALFQHSQEWDGGSSHAFVGISSYMIGATVKVINPNRFLANQLGFVNPAKLAWDVLPFSFVIDWFLPVGKFLGSLTSKVGLELKNEYRGPSVKINGVSAHIAHDSGFGYSSSSYGGERVVGAMPTPSLFDRLRVPKLDPWLAITSVSLAVQQLGRLRSA